MKFVLIFSTLDRLPRTFSYVLGHCSKISVGGTFWSALLRPKLLADYAGASAYI